MSPTTRKLQLARTRGVQAALDALPMVAAEVGISEELRGGYRRNTKKRPRWSWPPRTVRRTTAWPRAKRRFGGCAWACSNTSAGKSPTLRNQNLIDDIVLRELQTEMDLEEVQLLDPADSE